jgi:predicted protein tyrosine phosphatase
MIQTVLFVSQQQIENHIRPRPGTMLISITTPGDRDAIIPDGYHSVLRLQMDDLYEEAIGDPVGLYPDVGIDDNPVLWRGLRMPDGNHALQIMEYLCAKDISARHLIVHCHAGISRFVAVAQFVADRFGAELIGANPDTSCSNKRLLRLLNKVADGEPLTRFKQSPQLSIENPVKQACAQTQGLF